MLTMTWPPLFTGHESKGEAVLLMLSVGIRFMPSDSHQTPSSARHFRPLVDRSLYQQHPGLDRWVGSSFGGDPEAGQCFWVVWRQPASRMIGSASGWIGLVAFARQLWCFTRSVSASIASRGTWREVQSLREGAREIARGRKFVGMLLDACIEWY